MRAATPTIVPLKDIDCSKLGLGDGRASFRPVLYEDRHAFVHIPRSRVVGVDEFRDDKGGVKHYLSLDVTRHVDLLAGLSSWLARLAPQTHPLTRESDGHVLLKMRLPRPDDDASRPGVFDEDARETSVRSIRVGCDVETVAHLANVWTMRGTTGLAMAAVQVRTYSGVARCLITTDADADVAATGAPTPAPTARCMIVE